MKRILNRTSRTKIRPRGFFGLGESPYTETPNKPSVLLDPTNIAGQTAAMLQQRMEAWKRLQESQRPTGRQPGRPDPMFDSNPLEYRPSSSVMSSSRPRQGQVVDPGFGQSSQFGQAGAGYCPSGSKFVCLKSNPPQCYCSGTGQEDSGQQITNLPETGGEPIKLPIQKIMPMPYPSAPWSGSNLVLKPAIKQVWGDTVVTPTVSRVSGEDQLRAAAKEMTSTGMPVYGTASKTNIAEPTTQTSGKGTNATSTQEPSSLVADQTSVGPVGAGTEEPKKSKSWVLPVVGAVVLFMLFGKGK